MRLFFIGPALYMSIYDLTTAPGRVNEKNGVDILIPRFYGFPNDVMMSHIVNKPVRHG